MNISLILSIAKTLLLARRKQTIVAGIGVTFGITMFITLVSFMTGLNELLDGLILNRTPHIRLYNELKPKLTQPIDQAEEYKGSINFIGSIKPQNTQQDIYNSLPILHYLKTDPRVYGVAAKLVSPLFFNIGDIRIAGFVNGIEASQEDKLFHFSDYIIQGKTKDLTNVANSIILGKGLADKLMVHTGDIIYITTSKGQIYALKVVGLCQIGIAELDNSQSYASIETTQKIIGEAKNYITDIQIKLQDIALAPALSKEYSKLFNVDAMDIQTANAQFETGTTIRNIITYAVSITLLIVAGFGIYNILNMLIYEKMDTIAILKATGFSGNDVKWIFISLALIIGFIGGILGLLFGFIFSSIIDQIPFGTSALPGVSTYPVTFNPLYYIIGIAFASITTYIAGLLPALKASKIDPVVIIRGK